MIKRVISFLFLLATMPSCDHDYTVMTREPEVIYEQVEVPVYIEVEVPTGTPAEEVEIWVDSFVQVRAVDGVDIIWVIDTSGSMNSYQPQLLAGIELMMNALPEVGWRLVMISTDPDEAVSEQQFPLVPGDSYSDAEDMYNLMNTGPDEKGFDAIMEYMEFNPYAATWMRSDAALLVVFVSDEDDQSDTLVSASDFVGWYSSRRFGNVFLASIVMQTEEFSACDGGYAGSQPGLTYMEATDLLFGSNVDICAEDWSPGVTDATSQIEPYEKITLSKSPIKETIRVFIDGQLNHDWVYVESTNTVEFLVIPGGGSLVEVGYVISAT
tara:strand:- start:173 stop:1147 length:975 start_codon:yes stop_codon:yes gene_type:complete